MHALIQIFYLIGTALFVMSLHWMSDPKTARRGVFAGVAAMLLAVLGTLLNPEIVNYTWIAVAIVLGCEPATWMAAPSAATVSS